MVEREEVEEETTAEAEEVMAAEITKTTTKETTEEATEDTTEETTKKTTKETTKGKTNGCRIKILKHPTRTATEVAQKIKCPQETRTTVQRPVGR